ncbi:MAG: DUF2892 domain-containing protein [Chitinophagaceae bacterium]
MKQNMGTTDRVARLVLASLFAVLWFQHIVTGTFGIIVLVLGCVFLLTSVIGTCPLYNLFGISTCTREKTTQ